MAHHVDVMISRIRGLVAVGLHILVARINETTVVIVTFGQILREEEQSTRETTSTAEAHHQEDTKIRSLREN
jgi:hypothetical protein